MNVFTEFTLLILSSFLCYVSSCAVKQKTGNMPEKPAWDTKRYKRPIYKNEQGNQCSCADALNTQTLSYLLVLYKRVDADKNNNVALCTATLVTSNILVTSNKCFANANETLYPYDSWKNAKGKRHTIPVENLFATLLVHLRAPASQRVELLVKEIVLNPDYLLSSQKENEFPVDDLALIVLNDTVKGVNILKFLQPACLPKPNQKIDPTDVFYRTGVYDGIGGLVSDDPTEETRFQIDVVTLRAKECKAQAEPGFGITKHAICVRFRNPPPLKLGGSLHIVDAHNRTFLVGIATKVGYSYENANLNYAYFTNVLPLVKFIDRYATRHKSLWCHAPPLDLSNNLTTGHIAPDLYKWEGEYVPPPRNETVDCVCGLKNNLSSSIISRIAGGEEASPYEFPWMVKLYLDTPEGAFQCGASIINDRVILTAGHCVVQGTTEFEASSFRAYVRTHQPGNDPYEVLWPIQAVVLHPDYLVTIEKGAIDADVALLITSMPFPFTIGNKIVKIGLRPVCLPKWKEDLNLVGKMAEQSGWGLTDVNNTGTISKVLKKIMFPIRPLDECVKHARSVVTNHVICAGTLNVTQTSAQGDSGGPLSIQHGKDNLWTQVGAVSFDSRNPIYNENGVATAYGPHPVFYANLQHYMPFIEFVSNVAGAQYCRSSLN